MKGIQNGTVLLKNYINLFNGPVREPKQILFLYLYTIPLKNIYFLVDKTKGKTTTNHEAGGLVRVYSVQLIPFARLSCKMKPVELRQCVGLVELSLEHNKLVRPLLDFRSFHEQLMTLIGLL